MPFRLPTIARAPSRSADTTPASTNHLNHVTRQREMDTAPPDDAVSCRNTPTSDHRSRLPRCHPDIDIKRETPDDRYTPHLRPEGPPNEERFVSVLTKQENGSEEEVDISRVPCSLESNLEMSPVHMKTETDLHTEQEDESEEDVHITHVPCSLECNLEMSPVHMKTEADLHTEQEDALVFEEEVDISHVPCGLESNLEMSPVHIKTETDLHAEQAGDFALEFSELEWPSGIKQDPDYAAFSTEKATALEETEPERKERKTNTHRDQTEGNRSSEECKCHSTSSDLDEHAKATLGNTGREEDGYGRGRFIPETSHIQMKHARNIESFRCSECDSAFSCESLYKSHVTSTHGSDAVRYQCARCDHACKSKQLLIHHWQTKHDTASNCANDDKQPGSGNLKIRRQTKRNVDHHKTLHECEHCDRTFNDKCSLKYHRNMVHNPDAVEHKCETCNYSTKDKSNFQKHVKVTHSVDPVLYECTRCNFTTKHKKSLRIHVETQHGTAAPSHRCSECDKAFRHKGSYRTHVILKHSPNADVHRCPECSYATKNRDYLKRHMERHGPQLYRCVECSYSSKSRRPFLRHWLAKHHAGAGLLKCTRCEYSTRLDADFKLHMKERHRSNVPIYRCSKCDLVLRTKCLLERHVLRKHDPTAPVFQCEHCDYKTKYELSLRCHVRAQHDVNAEWFRCAQCGHRTKDVRVHNRHVQVEHIKPRPVKEVFRCSLCDYTCKFLPTLEAHTFDCVARTVAERRDGGVGGSACVNRELE